MRGVPLSRTPPKAVGDQLRKEVGFGCPVPGCGSPYLELHHFDPPWKTENHHNPAGMVALCRDHHPSADAGAFTLDQLREFKRNGADTAIKGRFDWRRRDLLLVLGSNFIYQQMNVIKLNDIDVVSFSRDDAGYILLNANIPSVLPDDRAVIEENIWHNVGAPKTLRCPPSGKELFIEYHNGDYLSIEFFEIDNAEGLRNRYEHAHGLPIPFPITTVEINLMVQGTNIDINPKYSSISRGIMRNCFMSHNGGYAINYSDAAWKFRQNSAKYIDVRRPRNAACLCGSGLRYKHCHGAIG